ncbi:GntR family transcriptional regulator [Aestuariivita sp.]|jgi:DNA-binding GntR family transcriptional regulator|uniref:GntR family transcriptional regulator n=1 Tax=Aestuariivita sp. TaxID=1872407 RepID=UPI002173CEA7|nr:GntR family transcriptional regulator [Aestuariivita sp.]MCE8007159.1 GntR family transcriptional regulator [Aestuariivita sp.]
MAPLTPPQTAKTSPPTEAAFSAADPLTLSDEVYEALREGLLIGEWMPGAKITARNVAKQYDVSLTPARDAMTRLANEGGLLLSETRMYSIPKLSAEDYLDVTRVRLALEPMATELATARITDQAVHDLQRINEDMRDCVEAGRYQDGLILDSRFHLGLYRFCGSPVLWQVINNLWLRIGPTRNMLSKTYRRGLSGYSFHQKILSALAQRDAALAAKLIRRDLKLGASKLENALRGQS